MTGRPPRRLMPLSEVSAEVNLRMKGGSGYVLEARGRRRVGQAACFVAMGRTPGPSMYFSVKKAEDRSHSVDRLEGAEPCLFACLPLTVTCRWAAGQSVFLVAPLFLPLGRFQM